MVQQERKCRKHDFMVPAHEGFLRTCLSYGYVEDLPLLRTDQKTDPWQGWLSFKIRPVEWPECVKYAQKDPEGPPQTVVGQTHPSDVYGYRPNMQTSLEGETQRESRPYVYSNLPKRSHIRMLKLSPGTRRDTLSGYLSVVDCAQDESLAYSALSYTWADHDGDTSLSKRIFLGEEKRALPITFNCDRALRSLRQKSCSIILWVDSICINQSSPSERSHQVGLMNFIYSNAKTVHTYVGEEIYGTDETGAEAMALLKDLQGMNNFDDSSLNKTSNINILNKFFSRSYFARMWVVQELLLAQSITLHCGQLSLEISNKAISQLHEQSIKIPSWVRFAGKTVSQSHQTPVSLRELLASTGVCRMTDLRDKVFGLLGLVGADQALDLRPSYELMVREVYIGVAAYLIDKHQFCDIIQHTNPYWMKDNFYHTNFYGIPSWVPTWDAYVPLQASQDLSRLTQQTRSDCEQLAMERFQLDRFTIRVLEGWPHEFDSRCTKTGQRCKTVYVESACLATNIEIVFRFISSCSSLTTQSGHAESTYTLHEANETDDHEYFTNFWEAKGGLTLAVRSFAWVSRLLPHKQGLDEIQLIRIEGCAELFLACQIHCSSQYRLIGPCVAAVLWQTNHSSHGESFRFDDLRLFSQFTPLTVEMIEFMAQWRNWVFGIARSDLADDEHAPSIEHQSSHPSSTGNLEQSHLHGTRYEAFLNQEDWKTSKNRGELQKQLPTLFKFWYDVHEMYNCFNQWKLATESLRVLVETWKTDRNVTPRGLLGPLDDWWIKSNTLTKVFENITGVDFIIKIFELIKPLIKALMSSVVRAASTNLCDEKTISVIIRNMETILEILKDDWPFFDKVFPSKLESIHPAYNDIQQTMQWMEILKGFPRTETETKRAVFY